MFMCKNFTGAKFLPSKFPSMFYDLLPLHETALKYYKFHLDREDKISKISGDNAP
jgi:hypothetical protein